MRLLFSLVLFFSMALTHANTVLTRLDGKDIAFEQLKGKWVFINYWATWCAPCLEEIPHFNRLASEKKGSVVVFGVNYDAVSAKEQRQLSRQYNLRYPSLLNNPAEILRLGDIRGVPVTFIFNPQGQLQEVLHGGQSYENLLAVISK